MNLKYINFKPLLAIALCFQSLNATASVLDDTVKALVDNSYNMSKEIVKLKKQMKSEELKVNKLQMEIERLKLKSNIVDLGKKNNVYSEIPFEPTNAIVVSWAAHIRKEPNKNSTTVAYVNLGRILSLVGESKDGEWYTTPSGYVRKSLVAPLNPQDTIVVVPLRKTINIRKSPYFGGNNIVSTVDNSAYLTVYPVLFFNKWYKIENGPGYVYKNVVKKVN